VKISRFSLSLKALRELGPRKMGLFALYQLGLRTGYFRSRTAFSDQSSAVIHPLWNIPDPDTILQLIGPEGLSQLTAEADEIVEGRVRLFGGRPVPLHLTLPGKRSHWTDYALGKPLVAVHQVDKSPDQFASDIKYIWEPVRFGWAYTLGRAFYLTGDERYPEAFWRYFEIFQRANPVNQGPNWESAQEVGVRLIALIFATQIFADSKHSNENRKSKIAAAIASHAARIPPTLIYARSQNNNHLLSEAAGLITASLALSDHPEAKRWSKLGWKWFQNGLQSQIAEDGTYMQQSTNYHRLVLQLALWVYHLSRVTMQAKGDLPEDSQPTSGNLQSVIPNLQQATRWLLALVDPETGRVPNLGPNDGAYIFPLTVHPIHDYRPVLQAASHAFLGEPAFRPGAWDEMSLWFISGQSSENNIRSSHGTGHRSPTNSPAILHTQRSWAYLRAACFHDRPGHADQLHLDLWWRGLNVAQDAGTYSYNAGPPWNNTLTHTAVHNTVMVDNHQQMTPCGRFLYLDWAQAEVLSRKQSEDGSWERVVAAHDGYRRLGVTHQRSVIAYQDGHWEVQDQIIPTNQSLPTSSRSVRLHWLLPDWEWKIDDSKNLFEVLSPFGWIGLKITWVQKPSNTHLQASIFRAGELLHGEDSVSPTRGWVSPTYGVKLPALSIVVTTVGDLPLTLISKWEFPND
jgi:hypothetical protein